jgi:hypothetical protein
MKIFIFLLVSSLLFVSCAAMVVVDYDKQTDFTKYKTYQFYRKLDSGLNELDNKRIIAAVDSLMAEKGWQRTDYNQFYIDFFADAQVINSRNTIGIGLGTGGDGITIGGGFGIPIGGKQLNQKITIEIFEERQGQPLVWQATFEDDIREVAASEIKEKHLKEMVAEILKNFPPQK